MKGFSDFELECIVFNEKITTRKRFRKIMRKEILSRRLAKYYVVTNKYNSPSRYSNYFNHFNWYVEGLKEGLSLYA